MQYQKRQIHTGTIINIVDHVLIKGHKVRYGGEHQRDAHEQQREQVRGDAGAAEDALRLVFQGYTVKKHNVPSFLRGDRMYFSRDALIF